MIFISEMIESMLANKETKKKAEEEKNKENEEGSVPLQTVEGAWIGSYINCMILICKT